MKNNTKIFLITIIVLNILVSYFYLGYQHGLIKGDAVTYFYAAKFLDGGQMLGPEIMNRILTVPLFLYSSIFVNYLSGDLNLSIAIVNVIFYFACVCVFYLLGREIYKENKIAILSTVLFACNYYLIDPVNAHLADMGGWLFFLVSTYLAIRYFNSHNRKFYYLSILLAVIGVLFKEYGGFGIVSLTLLIGVSSVPNKQKIKYILVAGFLFLLPLLAYHLFVYLNYHYSYFDWFSYVKNVASQPGYQTKSFILFVKILGWLFSFGWLAFVFGVKEEYKTMDKNRIKILLAILPSTLFFIIWPAITQRLAVIFMIWLALIAGFGLSKMRWYWSYPLLVIYILFNYNIKFLIDAINLPF